MARPMPSATGGLGLAEVAEAIPRIKGIVEGNGGLVEFKVLATSFPGIDASHLEAHFDLVDDSDGLVVCLRDDLIDLPSNGEGFGLNVPLVDSFNELPLELQLVTPKPASACVAGQPMATPSLASAGPQVVPPKILPPRVIPPPNANAALAVPGVVPPLASQAMTPLQAGLSTDQTGASPKALVVPPPASSPGAGASSALSQLMTLQSPAHSAQKRAAEQQLSKGKVAVRKVDPMLGPAQCPLCSRTCKDDTCQQCLGTVNVAHMKPQVLKQVERIKEDKAEKWQSFCGARGLSPALELSKYHCGLLMRFLDSENVKPDTGVPDHVNLFVVLVATKNVGEVYDCCKWYREGLRPVNIALAAVLLCKHWGAVGNDKATPPEKDQKLRSLVDKACARAHSFTEQTIVQVATSFAQLGATGSHLMPICEAALQLVPQPKPEDLAPLARAFQKMLGDKAAPLVHKMLDKLLPMVKVWQRGMTQNGLTRLHTLMCSLLMAKVQAEELYSEACVALLPHAKDLSCPQLAQLCRAMAEYQLRDVKLLAAIAEEAVQKLVGFDAEALSDIAHSFWTLDVSHADLLQRIGEATSLRLSEFNVEQLERIECAYAANGFTAPKEWFERSVALTLGERQAAEKTEPPLDDTADLI